MISAKSVLSACIILADALAIFATRISVIAINVFLLRHSALSSLCRPFRKLTSRFGSGFTPAFSALSLVLVIYVSSFFDNIWWILIYDNGIIVDVFPE